MTVPIYNMTDTWNNAGTVFKGIMLAVADSGHAAGSLLMDLQVGGVSKFNVDPNGVITGANFSGSNQGLVPASPGGSTAFLRADGTWATPAYIAPGAPSLAMQYNNAGAFGGMSGTSWNDAGRILTMTGARINPDWLNWVGESRVSADVSLTNTTALAPVTGLSVNVIAGRTYTFIAYLSFTCVAAAGIAAAIAGTCTATAIEYDGYIIDSGANGIKGNAQATALGALVADAPITGAAGLVKVRGTITVNAAGTLLVQAAQSVANATATVIKRGSTFMVHDIQ